MNSKDAKFKELQDLWYKKLADSGFKDAERRDGQLNDYHDIHFRGQHSPTSFEAKQEYYRAATHFLIEHSFPTSFDKFVWEQHTEGYSIRKIVDILKAHKNQQLAKKAHKRYVHESLQNTAKEMKKSWKT